jgi:hypothetical protein
MNNEEENIKKLVSALADLLIVWMIDIERKQTQTKGLTKNGTFKIRRSLPENPRSN